MGMSRFIWHNIQMQDQINNNQSLQTPTFSPHQKIENKFQFADLNIRVEESQDREPSDHEGHELVSRRVSSSTFEPLQSVKPKAFSPIQSNVLQDKKQQILNSNGQGKIKCQTHKIQGTKETMFICLQKQCKISTNKMESRIMCPQCINQQLHKEHLFYTVAKLEQICCLFHDASLQTAKTAMSKIIELRYRFERLIEQFIQKVQETLFIKHLKPTNSPSTETLIFTENEKISKLINQEVFQQLLTQNPITSMAQILTFQQEAISEQIENIYNNFEDSIKDGMANIDFINQHKNLLFNPDDMHADDVGLTLDRNKLEAITLATHTEKEGNQNLTKFAFTQSPLRTEDSKSFRINSIKDRIIIGCVDREAHQIISSELTYENCQHLIMGISISSTGQITLYNRGEEPINASNVEISQNDIIEITLHHKQCTLVITRYSALDGLQQQISIGNQLNDKNASVMGNLSRHIITTLSIESMDEPLCYPFAAVTAEGDSVSIVENIVLRNVSIDNQARKVGDSFEQSASEPKQFKKGFSKITAFKEKQRNGKKSD